MLVTLGTISQAQAKKPEDQEFRRVIVTLTSGEKVTVTCSAVTRRILRTEKGKLLVRSPRHLTTREPVKYTADEVESIEYVEKTEAHPTASGKPRYRFSRTCDRYRTFRRLVCLNKANRTLLPIGEDMDNRAVGNIDRRVLKTVYGIRFIDDPTDRLSVCWLSTMLVENSIPDCAVLQTWFKGLKARCAKRGQRERRGCWICTTLTSPPRRTNKSAFRDRVNIRRLFH